ncbi:hypothetical protein FAGAP_12376 [Fusarium agapanthi]|uniref:Uncharacterized protein n=1 Tax=Fusarium agapanthi TaxID=1803897 RepID=A0A9P5AXI9_9HYPO|nr:hypothetical protein FAGAP_12376 [Fusarium agapanthi]
MPAQSRSDPSLPTIRHNMNEANYFNVPHRTTASPSFAAAAFTASKPKYENLMKHQPSLPSMPENRFSSPLTSDIATPRPTYRQSLPSSSFGVDPPRPPRDGFERSTPFIRISFNIPFSATHLPGVRTNTAKTTLQSLCVGIGARPLFAASFRHALLRSISRFQRYFPQHEQHRLDLPDEQFWHKRTHKHSPLFTAQFHGLLFQSKEEPRIKAEIEDSQRGSLLKDDVVKPKLRRRLFGRAPWARKESAESFSSVTSSVSEILKVHVNCVNGQFPGGEARRIKTPPLADDTASGRPRSFFTETVPPTEDDEMGSPSRKNSLQTVRRQSIVADTYEWWEKMPKKPVRRSPFQERPPFEFQLPEHLPSSPMCPANEKHASGGTGVCVYHGRRKCASRLVPV